GDTAVISGAAEVAGPVVAGTLTTVAVFVPVVFVGELAGVLFGEMAMAVSFALFCSLVASLTIVPMLSARILGKARAGGMRSSGGFFGRVERAYGALIRASFAAPWAVVLGS